MPIPGGTITLRDARSGSTRVVTLQPHLLGRTRVTQAGRQWAARAGTSAPVYGLLADIAWTAPDGAGGPQPVACKQANGYGLFGMIGKVWEWCRDHADTARYGDYRSLRGAGWDDPQWGARASVRRGSAPDAGGLDTAAPPVAGTIGSRQLWPPNMPFGGGTTAISRPHCNRDEGFGTVGLVHDAVEPVAGVAQAGDDV